VIRLRSQSSYSRAPGLGQTSLPEIEDSLLDEIDGGLTVMVGAKLSRLLMTMNT
jgi:hypothetical protein